MKKILLILVAVILTASANAQSPEKMSYQAVVRNATNNLVTNQGVGGMQISILQTSPSSTAVYVETHTPTTNANGLVTIEIGSGTVVSGSMSTIDWSAGPYFIKTETDPTGGTTYTITGTSQLMSVPYALHSKTATTATNVTNDLVDDADANPSNELQTLSQVGSNVTLSNGGGTISVNDADASATNELQTISRTGTTVTLSNGGGTYQDSVNVYTAGTGIDITNNVLSATSPCGLAIGQSYQGGIIFYLDSSGCHGLISAPYDQSSGIRWYAGHPGLTRATGDGLYAGEANTTIIIAAQVAIGDDQSYYAAQICNNLQIMDSVVTYGDWYLPSQYELNLMYINKLIIGGFASGYYWSSTENGSSHARMLNFGNGSQFNGGKHATHYVRAIRAF